MGAVESVEADGSISCLVRHVRSRPTLMSPFVLLSESVIDLLIIQKQLKDQRHSNQEIVS